MACKEGQVDVVELMLNNPFKAFSINFAKKKKKPWKPGSRKSKNSQMAQNDKKNLILEPWNWTSIQNIWSIEHILLSKRLDWHFIASFAFSDFAI